jgi:hypothetical protein
MSTSPLADWPTACDVSGCANPWVMMRSGSDGTSKTRQHLCIDHRAEVVAVWRPAFRVPWDPEMDAQRARLKRHHRALWRRLQLESP